jgi:HKD family nuclease
LIPSDEAPDALTALRRLIVPGCDVWIAVAFVSGAGVNALERLIDGKEGVTLRVTARAAAITSPDALLALRDRLGADVSVVIGRGASLFHPKLWLIRDADSLHVLSGSGNLTEGGLSTNSEQFEHRSLIRKSAEGDEELRRFKRLTAAAVPLGKAIECGAWEAWLKVIDEQVSLRKRLRELDDELDLFDLAPRATAGGGGRPSSYRGTGWTIPDTPTFEALIIHALLSMDFDGEPSVAAILEIGEPLIAEGRVRMWRPHRWNSTDGEEGSWLIAHANAIVYRRVMEGYRTLKSRGASQHPLAVEHLEERPDELAHVASL